MYTCLPVTVTIESVMNVDVDVVVHDEAEEWFQPLGRSEPIRNDKTLIVSVAFGVVGVFILTIVILCLCKLRRKRRKLQKDQVTASNTTIVTTTSSLVPSHVELRTPEDVARRYERSVSSLSTKSQIYLVPFAVLPPDFDFSSREVEVKADYVVLKNLNFLLDYSSNNNEGGIINEAYERQEPYNPYMYIPPLIQEPYKKQEPFNPMFY